MKNRREKYIGDIIENNFKIYFPDYILLKREFYIPKIGYIDFLAHDTKTQSLVIIELKIGNGNPNQQLLAYKYGMENKLYENKDTIFIEDLTSNSNNIKLIGINESNKVKDCLLNVDYYKFDINNHLLLLKARTFE